MKHYVLRFSVDHWQIVCTGTKSECYTYIKKNYIGFVNNTNPGWIKIVRDL